MNLKKVLRKYLLKELLDRHQDNLKTKLADDTSLITSGLINSLKVMRLVNFIEDRFLISVVDETLQLENFDSIDAISDLVFEEARCTEAKSLVEHIQRLGTQGCGPDIRIVHSTSKWPDSNGSLDDLPMLDRVNCGVRPGEVDSSCLDCIDVNLATLLLHFGMNPVRPLFACQWYFEFDESSKDGLPVLRSAPLGHILETYAGYAIRKIPFEAGTCLPVLREHLETGQPLLVIGDAFLMPWLPYFGREHMAHSFIVNGFDRCEQAVLIVDNYYNRTVWGDAVPLETTLPASEIEPIARSLPERH